MVTTSPASARVTACSAIVLNFLALSLISFRFGVLLLLLVLFRRVLEGRIGSRIP